MKNDTQNKFSAWCLSSWQSFKQKHPTFAQFLVFLVVSVGVTLLQLLLMPAFKAIFNLTPLVEVDFQVWKLGDTYFFPYGKGTIQSGGQGGLAYFLAVELTLLIAQVINFFAQRKVTFKANNSIWFAAMWYAIAYVVITFVATAAQIFYKDWLYTLFAVTWNMGSGGELIADILTMMLNSSISFLVFFPIFKLIFKVKKDDTKALESTEN